MFDGPTSPVTQTFGLGLFAAPTSDDFAALESFFHTRGAPADHEVSPLADPGTLTLLNERGYHPIEFTSVLFQPVKINGASEEAPYLAEAHPLPVGHRFSGATAAKSLHVRVIGSDEADVWAQTAAEGWGMPNTGFMRDVARINADAPDGHLFVAEIDGRPVATGVLAIHGDVAHLAGASTIPAARGQGAQLALLNARLNYAAARGCDLALMGAAPGGGSQRNAERHGFRIAYTRIKWRLSPKSQT
jgi:GNAT superfamily N-acetyltransferase